jgi:predicted RNase H-like HicB family nuclease
VAHPALTAKLTIPFKRPIKPVYIRQLVSFIDAVETLMARLEYPVLLEPLPPEEGGGFLATVPDLPGCMSDGESPEEAIANVQDAILAWMEAARDLGHDIPKPSRRAA